MEQVEAGLESNEDDEEVDPFAQRIGFGAGGALVCIVALVTIITSEPTIAMESDGLLPISLGEVDQDLVVATSSITAVVLGFLGGTVYRIKEEEPAETHRGDIATGMVGITGLLILTAILLFLLYPPATLVLEGAFFDAAIILFFVALRLFLLLLATIIVVGIIVGIPAYIGVWVGSTITGITYSPSTSESS